MQKATSEKSDVEWGPQNLTQIYVHVGNSHLLDFKHSFIGEKDLSEKE